VSAHVQLDTDMAAAELLDCYVKEVLQPDLQVIHRRSDADLATLSWTFHDDGATPGLGHWLSPTAARESRWCECGWSAMSVPTFPPSRRKCSRRASCRAGQSLQLSAPLAGVRRFDMAARRLYIDGCQPHVPAVLPRFSTAIPTEETTWPIAILS
jgi:hypothetical protein